MSTTHSYASSWLIASSCPDSYRPRSSPVFHNVGDLRTHFMVWRFLSFLSECHIRDRARCLSSTFVIAGSSARALQLTPKDPRGPPTFPYHNHDVRYLNTWVFP